MGVSLPGAGSACDRRGADRLSECLQSDGHGDAREIFLVPNAGVRISRVAVRADLSSHHPASADALCDARITLDETNCLLPRGDHDPEWTGAYARDGVWEDGKHGAFWASDAGVLVVAVVVGGGGIFVVAALNALRSNIASCAPAFGREESVFVILLTQGLRTWANIFRPCGAGAS